MSLFKFIDLPSLGDDRGSLVALESNKNIPFDIKRIYYIFDNKLGLSRGFHAHKALKQVAICLAGRCKVVLDDGYNKEEMWLDSPKKGLIIGDMIWREMHEFSADCVFLVLASEYFDESDYIRSYSDFKDLLACKDSMD